jgi:glycosyltransferase involved in cell wall biosynthesis
MAAGLPVVAASSGAIPEVVGDDAMLFSPGDWVGLARALERGPLALPPGTRHLPDEDRLTRLSVREAASRLDSAYRSLL